VIGTPIAVKIKNFDKNSKYVNMQLHTLWKGLGGKIS